MCWVKKSRDTWLLIKGWGKSRDGFCNFNHPDSCLYTFWHCHPYFPDQFIVIEALRHVNVTYLVFSTGGFVDYPHNIYWNNSICLIHLVRIPHLVHIHVYTIIMWYNKRQSNRKCSKACFKSSSYDVLFWTKTTRGKAIKETRTTFKMVNNLWFPWSFVGVSQLLIRVVELVTLCKFLYNTFRSHYCSFCLPLSTELFSRWFSIQCHLSFMTYLRH